jgi:serine/threonine protein kinase
MNQLLDTRSPPASYVPLRIGDYDFHDSLGSGAFSIVRSGVNRTTGCRVAIKVIAKSALAEDNLQESFETELSIFQRLHHPNVVAFVAHLEDRMNHYVVMELCSQGRLLDRIVSEGKLAEPAACAVMNEVVSALSYLHSIGVVHRDIKPENILLDSNGHAKLSDFGLSRLVKSDDALLRTKCGSLYYAAPEVTLQDVYVGQQADVWSLGVVLYVMVAGVLPWGAVANHAQLLARVRLADFSVPWTVSGACRDLITRMVNPRPEQRITLEEAMGHEWMTGGTELRRVASLSQMIFLNCTESERSEFAPNPPLRPLARRVVPPQVFIPKSLIKPKVAGSLSRGLPLPPLFEAW